METDETETETSSKEPSEESVTEEDRTVVGGDGGDTFLTRTPKYPFLSNFFLLLLFVLLEWVCEGDRVRQYTFDPYTCPLHTY